MRAVSFREGISLYNMRWWYDHLDRSARRSIEMAIPWGDHFIPSQDRSGKWRFRLRSPLRMFQIPWWWLLPKYWHLPCLQRQSCFRYFLIPQQQVPQVPQVPQQQQPQPYPDHYITITKTTTATTTTATTTTTTTTTINTEHWTLNTQHRSDPPNAPPHQEIRPY